MTTLEKLLFWKAAGGGTKLYERTIINNPASFTTEVAKPLKGLTIPFLPIQSGTGDPSPSNIRPITGWTGLNIYRSGADTSDPLTIPVSWQSEAGTVYGGELDALTGVLTVEWYKITLTGAQTYKGFENYIKSDAFDMYYVASDADSTSDIYCNMLKKASANTSIYSNIGYPNYCMKSGRAIHFNIANDLLGITDYTQETMQTATEKMEAYLAELYSNGTPIEFMVRLATPFTVQLDPVTLSTLIGENVIWTDTNSDNTIVYLSNTQGGGLGGGFGGGFGSGSDDPGDPENPGDPIEPDDPINPDDPEIPEEPVTDE